MSQAGKDLICSVQPGDPLYRRGGRVCYLSKCASSKLQKFHRVAELRQNKLFLIIAFGLDNLTIKLGIYIY